MKIQNIPVSKIIPDVEQPRKDFDVTKLSILRSSIKEHGILSPLTVEEMPEGTYLLIDGERRYRMAKELNIKEVPALVRPPTNKVKRMLEQFHIQNTHAGWTHIEKANAIHELSKILKIPMKEMAEMAGIGQRSATDYVAFFELIDPKKFQASDIPIKFAPSIRNTIGMISKIAQNQNETIDRGTLKQLEHAIYRRILTGELKTSNSVFKFSDIVKAGGTKSIEILIDEDEKLDELMEKTKARAASDLRRLFGNVRYSTSLFKKVIEDGEIKPSEDFLRTLKSLKGYITTYLNTFAD